MQTLIEVIKDLWNFCFKSGVQSNNEYEGYLKETEQYLLSEPKNEVKIENKENIEKSLNEINSQYGEKFYVAVSSSCLFIRPVWTFDGVIKKIAYSTAVSVLGYEGRFARVSVHDKFGFILKDELTSSQEDIFPSLHTGEIYSSNHPDTKRVRKIIDDKFFTTELFMPLQSIEFVTFRILLEGRNITWPDIRPRLAGSWQNILRGNLGIQISISPKTGAIIEYTKPDGTGFVGYTKSVHVDESIVVEGVGRLIDGEYREEAISKEEWQEWRPVWIQVN